VQGYRDPLYPLSPAEALHMGIRDSRLQIMPGGNGPIGATDAGVTRYALALLEGDHRSHGKSHVPAPSPWQFHGASQHSLAGRPRIY